MTTKDEHGNCLKHKIVLKTGSYSLKKSGGLNRNSQQIRAKVEEESLG